MVFGVIFLNKRIDSDALLQVYYFYNIIAIIIIKVFMFMYLGRM